MESSIGMYISANTLLAWLGGYGLKKGGVRWEGALHNGKGICILRNVQVIYCISSKCHVIVVRQCVAAVLSLFKLSGRAWEKSNENRLTAS